MTEADKLVEQYTAILANHISKIPGVSSFAAVEIAHATLDQISSVIRVAQESTAPIVVRSQTSPLEALQMAAEFAEQQGLFGKPNERGYNDKMPPPAEKSKILRELASYIMEGKSVG